MSWTSGLNYGIRRAQREELRAVARAYAPPAARGPRTSPSAIKAPPAEWVNSLSDAQFYQLFGGEPPLKLNAYLSCRCRTGSCKACRRAYREIYGR